VSNLVVLLLYSIKYWVKIPFSNIAATPSVHSVNMQQQQQKTPGVNCNDSGGSRADPKRLVRHSQTARLSKKKNIKKRKSTKLKIYLLFPPYKQGDGQSLMTAEEAPCQKFKKNKEILRKVFFSAKFR
jgi:hypothetical protein